VNEAENSTASPPAAATLGQRWRRAGHWRDRTVGEDIRRAAREHPGAAVVFHGSAGAELTTTLGELVARGERVAAGFQRLGLEPGDAVAIQVPNWAEGAVAHIAGWLAGAVVVPIVPIYGPREVGFILRQSGARAFVVARRWRDRDCAALLSRLPELAGLGHVAVIGDELAGTVAWAALEAETAPLRPPVVQPDDRCLLVYTSGTTADPKGVQHSHNTLLAEVHIMAARRDAGADVRALAAFPSGHVAGVLGLLRLLVRGVPTVVMDAWDGAAAARLVAEHRLTSSSGAPVYLATLLDEAERSGCDLSSLTEYMTGAANVSPALIERAARAGIAAYRGYGSSEHPTISSGHPDDPEVKRATTDGRITPGSEVRIVDADGRDLGEAADGEIVARGPEQFLGYLDAALDAGAFFPGRWLRTGDIGHLDADGYLTVTGRKKDIIVRGGEKISAKEVEDVLLGHPAVAEAAVVGAPDERYGERVCAFVVPRPGTSLDLDEVRLHFAAAGLARQKTPERLVIAAALPRTAAGKVRKHLLRDQMQSDH
jgi:acyl-CoA synthetase (AMP-forming)/AMP-acid ligase II